MNELNNYYEVLELAPGCSQEEIESGYLKAKNAYSQDSAALYSLMSPEECQAMLEMIEEAYGILSSPVKRRDYDIARGFETPTNEFDPRNPANSSVPITESIAATPAAAPSGLVAQAQKNISKIVTTQRFALQYELNPELEQQIETCSEFSGEFLQQIREYKNVDIQRMADMTKVSKQYLVKIENEDLTHLPALVYVRGFVYQYAKCLKLNPDQVATSYIHRIKRLREETGG